MIMAWSETPPSVSDGGFSLTQFASKRTSRPGVAPASIVGQIKHVRIVAPEPLAHAVHYPDAQCRLGRHLHQRRRNHQDLDTGRRLITLSIKFLNSSCTAAIPERYKILEHFAVSRHERVR